MPISALLGPECWNCWTQRDGMDGRSGAGLLMPPQRFSPRISKDSRSPRRRERRGYGAAYARRSANLADHFGGPPRRIGSQYRESETIREGQTQSVGERQPVTSTPSPGRPFRIDHLNGFDA